MTTTAMSQKLSTLITQLRASLPDYEIKPVRADSTTYRVVPPSGTPKVTIDCAPGIDETMRWKKYCADLRSLFGWTPADYHKLNLTEQRDIKAAISSGDASLFGMDADAAARRMAETAQAEMALAQTTIRKTILLDNTKARELLAAHLEACQRRDIAVKDEMSEDQIISVLKGHSFLRQRTPDDQRLRLMMKSMLDGHWYWTGDAINIASDGFILNGLQRVLTVYGIPNAQICTDIITGVDNKIWIVVDTGRPRRGVDTLKSLGFVDPSTLKSILSLLFHYDGIEKAAQDDWLSWSQGLTTTMAIGHYALQNKEALSAARLFSRRLHNRISNNERITTPSTAALGAAHYILNRDAKDTPWWEEFLTEATQGAQGMLYHFNTTDAVFRFLSEHEARLIERRTARQNSVKGRFPRAVEQLVVLLDAAWHEITGQHYTANLTADTPMRRFTAESEPTA